MNRFSKICGGLIAILMGAATVAGQSPEGGMWMPSQLYSLDTLAIQAAGLELGTAELYTPYKTSIKDAVVSFGGFCSGAFISKEGLLITNHHCAYGAIQSHNTRGKNLLETGFWAESREDELRNPGLEVTLLAGIEDVSRQILGTLKDNGSPEHKQRAIAERCKVLEGRYRQSTGLDAEIRPAYGGNAWHVYLTRTFKDVRLVGTPPSAIARFGGDVAGREWPMHTADFALFRVYADSSNAPAPYAEDNQPYRPSKFLRISMAPRNAGDFTMVMGYPGESSLSLSSYGVRERQEIYDPTMVRLNETILNILRPAMENSRQLRRNYESMYSSTQNRCASLKGEMEGLKKLDVSRQRLEEEIKLAKWIEASPERHGQFGDLLTQLRIIYLRREKLLGIGLHLEAALSWVGLLDFANQWRILGDLDPKEATPKLIAQRSAQLSTLTRQHFRSHSSPTDEKLCAALLSLLHKSVPESHRAALFPEIEKQFKGDFSAYAAWVYRRSRLASASESLEFLRDMQAKDLAQLRRDPGYALMDRLVSYYNDHYQFEWEEIGLDLWELQARYEAALGGMRAGIPHAPDANGTLRISFGKVASYQPEDGINYRYATTSLGILEKHRSDQEKYQLPETFVRLIEEGDFGPLGQNGRLMVNFLASNHTTNGNSGSPVMDGAGRLIGINSARPLESAVSDFIYDPAEIRNVVVDIRYVLFIVTRFAKADYVVKELTEGLYYPAPEN